MICTKYQCIFIHVPKTGGSSIENSLTPNPAASNFPYGIGHDPAHPILQQTWRQHFTFSAIQKFGPSKYSSSPTSNIFTLSNKAYQRKYGYRDKKIMDSYFSFAFVRNPLDRMVSEFFWRKGFQSGDGFGGKSPPSCFWEFVKNLDYYCDPLEAHYWPQYKFIYNDSGESQVDFIGKFENLQSDWDTICTKINKPRAKLPRIQSSKHDNYTKYYTRPLINIVKEIYEKDFDLFDYR